MLLRVEDLLPGETEHVASVLDDLRWLGLDWDAPDADTAGLRDAADFGERFAGLPPLVLQSDRAELHRAVLERLVEVGLCYACVCTRKDIEAALRAPHAEDRAMRYPGTCRGRFPDVAAAVRWEAARAGRRGALALGVALRMKAPREPVHFRDARAGARSSDVYGEFGDFVVRRKDGTSAYMLAVCIDDAAMGVTEVLRGDDLLEVTGQQVAVHAALREHCAGLVGRGAQPAWKHVPLVYGDDDRRLAKRNKSLHVRSLAEHGVPAEALRAWIAASLGLPADGNLSAMIRAYAERGDAAARAVYFDQNELGALARGERPEVRRRTEPVG